jgi:hypothetical protein
MERLAIQFPLAKTQFHCLIEYTLACTGTTSLSLTCLIGLSTLSPPIKDAIRVADQRAYILFLLIDE